MLLYLGGIESLLSSSNVRSRRIPTISAFLEIVNNCQIYRAYFMYSLCSLNLCKICVTSSFVETSDKLAWTSTLNFLYLLKRIFIFINLLTTFVCMLQQNLFADLQNCRIIRMNMRFSCCPSDSEPASSLEVAITDEFCHWVCIDGKVKENIIQPTGDDICTEGAFCWLKNC